MNKVLMSLIFVLASAAAHATPIVDRFAGIGFGSITGDDPKVYSFDFVLPLPTNDGIFTGLTPSIGNIEVISDSVATAADWTIGGYTFAIDQVKVLSNDNGLDFLLRGLLTGGQLTEPGDLLVLLETNGKAFTFASVPEPATWLLLGLGLAGLVGLRRRQGAPVRQDSAQV